MKITDAEKCAIKRFTRGTIALLIAGAAAQWQSNQKYIFAAPLLNAIAAWLKKRFGVCNLPI